MTNPEYQIKTFNFIELIGLINVSEHAEKQSGIFSKRTLESAKLAVEQNIVHPVLTIGAKMEDGKIGIIHSSDLFTHLLALYDPETMGVALGRTSIYLSDQGNCTVHPYELTDEKFLLGLRKKLEERNAGEEEIQSLERLVDLYQSYSVPVMLFDSLPNACKVFEIM
ncbi:hypothetical protein DZF79_28690 [Vibrio parahaemolyticus]|nr:hypothetical protein [Vibrio parahaemolyticus]